MRSLRAVGLAPGAKLAPRRGGGAVLVPLVCRPCGANHVVSIWPLRNTPGIPKVLNCAQLRAKHATHSFGQFLVGQKLREHCPTGLRRPKAARPLIRSPQSAEPSHQKRRQTDGKSVLNPRERVEREKTVVMCRLIVAAERRRVGQPSAAPATKNARAPSLPRSLARARPLQL